jgi:hypothetical protein
MSTVVFTQTKQNEEIELHGQRNDVELAAPPKNQDVAPRIALYSATLLKLISAGYALFVAGVNDGSTGALIPYMLRDYNINTAIVSTM